MASASDGSGMTTDALVDQIRREAARWAETNAVRKVLLRGIDARHKPKPA